MIVGLTGLWWRARFTIAVRRFDPLYPIISAWLWATASHEDAIIEHADSGEDFPTPREALAHELSYVLD